MNENTKTTKKSKFGKIKDWFVKYREAIFEGVVLGSIGVAAEIVCYNIGLKQGFACGVKNSTHLPNTERLMNVHSAWNNNRNDILSDSTVTRYMNQMGFTPDDIVQGSVVANFELTKEGLSKVNNVTFTKLN